MELSRGKRARKRKREDKVAAIQQSAATLKPEPPPAPEILQYLTVGYNSTHRALEALVQTRRQVRIQCPDSMSVDSSKQLAAIFVDRSSQPKIMHNHLPLLVAAASNTMKETHVIRLVALPNGSEEQLCTALHIPRVGLVGVYEEAVNAKPLLNFVREKVLAVDCSWLEAPHDDKYLALKIDTKIAKVPVLPPKPVRRQEAQKQSEQSGS